MFLLKEENCFWQVLTHLNGLWTLILGRENLFFSLYLRAIALLNIGLLSCIFTSRFFTICESSILVLFLLQDVLREKCFTLRKTFIHLRIRLPNLLNYGNMDSTNSSSQFSYVTTFEAIFQYLNFFLSFSSSIHLIRKTLYVLLMIRISLQQNNSGQLLQVATPSHRLMVTQHYFTRTLKSFTSFSLVTSRSHLLRHVTCGVTYFKVVCGAPQTKVPCNRSSSPPYSSVKEPSSLNCNSCKLIKLETGLELRFCLLSLRKK